jgi:HD-GYP domain-containing protein (c-di-GMP phosphodiesterase class II)
MNAEQKRENDLAAVYSMAYMFECRDETSGKHLDLISEIAAIITKELAKNVKYQNYIDDDYIETIRIGGMLHDIGKLGVSESILKKKGQLNEREFDKMKRHPELGAEKIAKLRDKFPDNPWYDMLISVIRYHHERYDGQGYPEGLKKDEIPLSARIVAVADVYEALRSKRPYKPGFSHWRSVEIIMDGSGSHFDPDVVNAFIAAEKEIAKCYSAKNKPLDA